MSKTTVVNERVVLKIVVLGCANVGKTSLMERFCTGKFSGARRPTIGADFMTKRMMIHDCEVLLQIWDTAGQERFHQGSLGANFFRGTHGALLVYDVTNERSFEQVIQWRDELLARNPCDCFFPIVVVGNKIDIRDKLPLEKRINQAPILDWCRDNCYGHVETSAKDDLGVLAAMNAISGLALELYRNAKMSTKAQPNETIRLNDMYSKDKSKCSCF